MNTLELRAEPMAETSRSTLWSRVLKDPVGATSLGVILTMVLVAVFAPLIAPQSPIAQDPAHAFASPSSAHWLGTDDLGRDVLSRLIFATRVSLLGVLIAVCTTVALGLPTGLLAGYLRGWGETVFGHLANAILSIPGIVLAIAIVTALGPGLIHAMIAVGISFSPILFRVTRAATLNVCEETYVHAAVVGGCSTPRVLLRHVLPNILSPLLVQITIVASLAVIAEAGLSFLGLGVVPPQTSWGLMLGDAFNYIFNDWQLMIWPGVCILLASLSFSLLGDVLRDSLRRGGGGR